MQHAFSASIAPRRAEPLRPAPWRSEASRLRAAVHAALVARHGADGQAYWATFFEALPTAPWAEVLAYVTAPPLAPPRAAGGGLAA